MSMNEKLVSSLRIAACTLEKGGNKNLANLIREAAEIIELQAEKIHTLHNDVEFDPISEGEILRVIDDQPTACEWIPFDPDNPPETGEYLITGTDGFDEFVDIDIFFNGGIGWEKYGHQVIAYMPTPEPYKPTAGEIKRWWKMKKEREECTK